MSPNAYYAFDILNIFFLECKYNIMKIGVFSDSHDHMINIEKATKVFLENDVQKIVHCGDLVAPFIKKAMSSLNGSKIEAVGVFGNNDGERDNMNRIFGDVMKIKGDFMELNWNGHKIAVYHGTYQKMMKGLIDSQKYDLVLTGHTHNIWVERVGKTLVVNPGETCGILTGKA